MREFSTELRVELIRIGGEDYEIRELTTEGRDRYLQALGDTMQVRMVGTGEKDKAGNEKLRQEIVIKSLKGTQCDLLKATMFRITEDGGKTTVSIKQIGEWGAKLTEQLARIASDLNGMSQPDKVLELEAEKN